jgi:Fe-Mn family superoxide dismutase
MYEIKNYDSLLGIDGLSNDLLKNHFTLYQGYVNNTNKLLTLLSTLDKSTIEYSELHRRFGWEFNGMRLHELYFENLSLNPTKFDANSNIGKLILEQYNSFDNFEKEFKSLTAMRGIGWVVLAYDSLENKLFNIWVNEHDLGLLAGLDILLVIDVFEHAYMLDYNLKKLDYVNAIFNSIDWKIVEKRFV